MSEVEKLIYGIPSSEKSISNEEATLREVRGLCQYWLNWTMEQQKKEKPHADTERVYRMAIALREILECGVD